MAGDNGSIWTQWVAEYKGQPWSKRHCTIDWQLAVLKDDGRYFSLSVSANVNVRAQELVMDAFVGPRPDNALICHKDDNGYNNAIDNLYFGDKKDNAKDCKTNGRLNVRAAHARHFKRFTEAQELEIIELKSAGVPYHQLESMFNASHSTLVNVVRRQGIYAKE
jgi:hypothetical protein